MRPCEMYCGTDIEVFSTSLILLGPKLKRTFVCSSVPSHVIGYEKLFKTVKYLHMG